MKPMGRPTKYKSEFCEMLIEHMSEGFSFEAFAGKLKVSRQVLYDWEKRHSEFKEAKDIGFSSGLYFWEREGLEGLYSETVKDSEGGSHSKSINAAMWIFNVKARFGWNDRPQNEHETVININHANQVVKEEVLKIIETEREVKR